MMTLQQRFERALMEGDLDEYPFQLAERLGMTLAQIGQMSNNEFLRWRAFDTYRAAMAGMK